MDSDRKLCDSCNWYDPRRQLCYESGRYMIVQALSCWSYDPIVWAERLLVLAGKDCYIKIQGGRGDTS